MLSTLTSRGVSIPHDAHFVAVPGGFVLGSGSTIDPQLPTPKAGVRQGGGHFSGQRRGRHEWPECAGARSGLVFRFGVSGCVAEFRAEGV